RVPAYAFPENAARALGKVAAYASWRREPPGLFWGFDDIHTGDAREVCAAVLDARGDDWLTAEEARRVLNAFGLPLLPTVLARSADDAAALAAIFGFPVVAKVQARQLLHKSDAGAVRVGLASERAVRAAFKELSAIAAANGVDETSDSDGVVLQPMISGG